MAVIRHIAKRYMLYPPRQSMTNTLPVLSPRFIDARGGQRALVSERVLPDWFRRQAVLSSLVLLSITITSAIAIRIHRVSTR